MDIRKLLLNEPVINTYPYVTNVSAIIGQNENIMNWIYSFNIQSSAFIATENDYTDIFFDFTPNDLSIFECPFIKIEIVSREFIAKKYDSFYEFIVESVNMGRYVYGVLNQYWFFDEKEYRPLYHDTFIFGYNKLDNTIDLADFTFTGKYSTIKIPAQSVNKAFEDVPVSDDNVLMNNGGFILFSKADDVIFDFDVNLVKRLLTAYLHPKSYYDISTWRVNHRMNAKGTPWHGAVPWYGIDVYEVLIDRVQKLSNERITFSDIRNMHVLYEHKKLMFSRVVFMVESGYLSISKDEIDRFEKLSNEVNFVKMIMLKESVKDRMSDDSFRKCINTLQYIVGEEKILYQLIIDNINPL